MNPSEEPLAEVGYGHYTDTATGRPSVMVEVTNRGTIPIDPLQVEWVYEFETPQEATGEFNEQHGRDFTEATGQRPVRVAEVGRRYSFNPAAGEKPGPLPPGETRVYLYPPEWLPAMLSVVQSLTPERYHIAITMNGKEEVAVPGRVFGEFLDRRFGGPPAAAPQ